MFEKAQNLIEKLRAIIQYVKRGKREQRLAFTVIACFSLAVILSKPESWPSFLQPLKNLAGDNLGTIAFVLAAIGSIAFLLLAWLIYRTAQPPERLPEKLSPSVIKGPLSFGPQDGEFFQRLGRENELRQVLSYVKDPQIPLVVVMGESGAGKTSLLRAGLDYSCKKENIPLVYWEAVPGEPVNGLIETVNRSWQSQFKTLSELLNASRERDAVIVLDQFEQLDRDDDQAKRIFEALVKACLLSPPPHRTTWIVAFRRDYDPEWRDFELENPKLKTTMLSLKLFNERQASGVMAAIAEEAGFTLDESLLSDLLNSFRSKEGISPVDIGISMLVLDNFARNKEEKHLTVSDYKIAGGSGGVLTSYLSEQLGRLPDAEREELLKVLLQLADLTQNKRISGGKTLSELSEGAKLPTKLLESELDRLSSPHVRLLESVPPSVSQKEKTYRLPHERIIRSLRELSGVFLAEAEQARLALETSFGIWNANRKSKYLLGGRELKRILRSAGQFDWGDEAEEKQLFIKQSRTKRTRTRLAATAILLMLSAISYIGIHQYRVSQIKRDLAQWGLPSDLYEYQRQLNSLTVSHHQVTHTAWIDGNLKELRLSSEGLRNIDTLPPSITLLDLSGTSLTSLAGIENLKNLTTLDVSSTQLTSLAGIENLKDLKNLTTLNLYSNQLTTLAGIENLKNLTTLNLSSNQLTTLAGIENLKNLTTLDLSYTGITSLAGIENLKDLKNLTTLNLNGNKLTALDGIENLKNLTTLNLNGNQLTTLAGIENLKNLTTLDLGRTGITSLAGIENLKNLTTLDVRSNQLNTLAGIENLKNLTTLDLDSNQLTTPAGIENLKDLKNLTTLDMSNNQLTTLAGIKNLKNLTTLDVGSNDLTTLAGIENLGSLTTLNVNSNRLTTLAGIENLKNLTALSLSYNELTTLSNIENLKNLGSLTTLKLSYNELTTLAGIENLKNLTTLDLDNNKLTTLSNVENLKNLTTLDVNRNHLTTLAGIENLENLTTLSVSYNQLTTLSNIENLKNLKNLTTLDVSSNQLTTLAGIENLENLSTLYLGRTRVTNLAGLEKCAKLKTLEIYGLSLGTLSGLPGSVEKLSLGASIL